MIISKSQCQKVATGESSRSRNVFGHMYQAKYSKNRNLPTADKQSPPEERPKLGNVYEVVSQATGRDNSSGQ